MANSEVETHLFVSADSQTVTGWLKGHIADKLE